MNKQIEVEEVEVWKVLNKKDRTSCSTYFNFYFPHKFVLKYPVNKFIKPKLKKSKIFCFKTRQNAINFIEQTKRSILNPYPQLHLLLVKAIAQNPVSLKWVSFDNNRMEYFWSKKVGLTGDTTLVNIRCAPEGTMVCDALKCLE